MNSSKYFCSLFLSLFLFFVSFINADEAQKPEGHLTVFHYDSSGQLISLTKSDGDVIYFDEESNSGLFSSFFQWIFNNPSNHSLTESHESYWDSFLSDNFSPGFLQMAGLINQEPDQGSIGLGEIGDNIRVTLINGMGNLKEDVIDAAQLISSTHGDINVHYIFRPTDGWTRDLMNGLFSKMGFSPYSYKIAALWRDLIQEMGGVHEGGQIVHYAHSMGGTDTYKAIALLTPEEQKMLKIITVGSSTLIAPYGFDSSMNFVSCYDVVPLITDSFGSIYGLVSSQSNIFYIGNCQGYPFIDHVLSSGTYRELMLFLGKQFRISYGKVN